MVFNNLYWEGVFMKRIVTIFTIACVLLSMSIFLPVSAATVDFSVNFDEEPDGATANETLLGDEFIMSTGTPASSATVEPDENGGSLHAMTGYTDIKSIMFFDTAYTFQVDFITNAKDNTGVFVKSVEPEEFILVENPKNANTLQTFNFYEWDWYKENGGTAEGCSSSIGGSGIFVMPGDGIIRIGIKTYQPDGLTVATRIFELPAPEGYQLGERCTIQIKDDIATVSVSINDTPLAVIELSEPGTEYDGDDPVYGFYKTAVVKDAAGTELGTVENTRVCSEYSLIAITTRNQELSIDNVVLQYEEDESNATEAPSEPTGEGDATEAPTTSGSGAATPTPARTSSSTARPSASENDEDSNTPIIIAAVVAAVVVVAGIIIAVVVAKKKKKSS